MTGPPMPSIPHFYIDGEPHFTPEVMMAYVCESTGITREEISVAPVLVGTFAAEVTSFLAERHGGRRSGHWAATGSGRDLYDVDGRLCVATVPPGAPAAVSFTEELIACGARKLLIVGMAGSLQPDLPIGSVVLPTSAIREEGTSHHYLPAEVPATATPALVEALKAAWKGSGPVPRAGFHWTTDAPYREHGQKIDAYREAGVLSVDMEVSALYSLAQHRGVAAAAIVAISDELYEPWRLGFRTLELRRAVARAGLAALDAAFKIS